MLEPGAGVAAMVPTEASVSCEVLLENILVLADIGAHAKEHGVPQPLHIHVALTVVPPAEDDLAQTFDYNGIREAAKELAGQRIALIETFAQRLAWRCLENEVVLAVEVRIDKPRAVPGCLAATRVRVSRV